MDSFNLLIRRLEDLPVFTIIRHNNICYADIVLMSDSDDILKELLDKPVWESQKKRLTIKLIQYAVLGCQNQAGIAI